MRHTIKTGNQTSGRATAHAAPTPPVPDPLAALQAQVAAQAIQINALQTQVAAQQIQIAALQAHFPPPAPDISNGENSSVDAAIAKSAVSAAPGAWEFITSDSAANDPNVDLSNCTSLTVLADSDDGGAVWSRNCNSSASTPLRAARYQLGGKWSLFSGWITAGS